MKSLWAPLVLALALEPCPPSAKPDASKEAKAPAEPGPSALDDARKSVTAHMGEHVTRALSIHDAVVMGRLADAKQPAGYLAKHWPDQVLETWIPFVRSLRSTAAEVEHAENLQAAAKGTADLALSCGECHEALDDGPKFASPPALPSGDEPAAVMQRHRWATDRLWEGVIQPSSERWMQGIDALQRLPDCQENPGGEQLTADIEAARATTERVRLQAKDATDLRDRARLYGELLGTCSTCHLAGC